MRIIIVGAGEVGESLCHLFSERGHDVTLIESSEAVAASVEQSYNAKVIHDNGRCAKTLLAAGVEECDYFMAMTHDDPTNILACEIAKALGAKQTIARIHDQTYSDQAVFNYQLHFGIDLLITPEALCAFEIVKHIRNPGRAEVEHFARGQIEVQSNCISLSSKLINRTLGEIKIDRRVRVIYLQRGDFQDVPSRDTILKPGDIVTLIGPVEALSAVNQELAPEHRTDFKNIIIFGGSETALALLRILTSNRFRIKLIESDSETCRVFAEQFKHITVINADPQFSDLLEEAGVRGCDHFIACAKADEKNFITCLQARHLGAQQVHMVVNNGDYESVLTNIRESINLQCITSPRGATINELWRYVSQETCVELSSLGQVGKVLQFWVPPSLPIVGKYVREIPWPKGTIVAGLLHKYQVRIPSGDDKILGGDRLILITHKDKIPELMRFMS